MVEWGAECKGNQISAGTCVQVTRAESLMTATHMSLGPFVSETHTCGNVPK